MLVLGFVLGLEGHLLVLDLVIFVVNNINKKC